MGRRLRRCCTGMGKPAVMKARTRAVKRLCLAAAEGRRSSKRLPSGDHRNSHIALRRRSVILGPQIERPMENSSRQNKSICEFGRISRCSSDASCEVSPARSMSSEIGQECDTALSLRADGERRETTASNNHRDEASDLESTVETEPSTRSRASKTPSNAELEDFFAAAERDLLQRFSARYNFDIINDSPLDGRYEWIPLTP